MGRSPCCEKSHTNNGAWTKEEDQRLVSYIKANGEGCWRSLPMAAGLIRCGKSCRLRWINYLRPDLKRGNFTEEEDDLIINLQGFLETSGLRSPGGCRAGLTMRSRTTGTLASLLDRGIDTKTNPPAPLSVADTATPSTNPHDHLAAAQSSCSPETSCAASHSSDIDLNLSISQPGQPSTSLKPRKQETEGTST